MCDASDDGGQETGETETTWHPQSCGMPELDVPGVPVAPWATVTIFLARCGPKDGRARVLFTNFARLIDHAVREYQTARAEFLAYVDAKPGE